MAIHHNLEQQAGEFHWWEGVVEDNLDPTGAGRCKVRVIAHNSPMKSDISVTELPWAYPVMPLNNPHGKVVALKPGTRVTGFYRDGRIGQDLVMLGTINTGYGTVTGYDEDAPALDVIRIADPIPRVGEIGFVDDRAMAGTPIPNQPQKTKVISTDDGVLVHQNISDYGPLLPNEINTSRLTRGVLNDTITQAHIESQANTFVTKVDETKIAEPATPFGALYPYNTVEESDSGHLREVDDTPGFERIKETHRTGTFYEIHPDGSRVTKIVNDDFSVTIGDSGVKISGNCAVHVVGQADFYCESDIQVKTDKNANVWVSKDAVVDVGNDITAIVDRDLVATVKEDAFVDASGNLELTSEKDIGIFCDGSMTFKDAATGTVSLKRLKRDKK